MDAKELEKLRTKVRGTAVTYRNAIKLWSAWNSAESPEVMEILEDEYLLNPSWICRDIEPEKANMLRKAFAEYSRNNGNTTPGLFIRSEEELMYRIRRIIGKDVTGEYSYMIFDAMRYGWKIEANERKTVNDILDNILKKDVTGEYAGEIYKTLYLSIGHAGSGFFRFHTPGFRTGSGKNQDKSQESIRKHMDTILKNIISGRKPNGAAALFSYVGHMNGDETERTLLEIIAEGDSDGKICRKLFFYGNAEVSMNVFLKYREILVPYIDRVDRNGELLPEILKSINFYSLMVATSEKSVDENKDKIHREAWFTREILGSELNDRKTLFEHLAEKDSTGKNITSILVLVAKNFIPSEKKKAFSEEMAKKMFVAALKKNYPHPKRVKILPLLWTVAKSMSLSYNPGQDRQYWEKKAAGILDHIINGDLGKMSPARAEILTGILLKSLPVERNDIGVFLDKNTHFHISMEKNEFKSLLDSFFAMGPSANAAAVLLENAMMFRTGKNVRERLVEISLGESSGAAEKLTRVMRAVPLKSLSPDLAESVMRKFLETASSKEISDLLIKKSSFMDEISLRMGNITDTNPVIAKEAQNGKVHPFIAMLMLLNGDFPPGTDVRNSLLKSVSSNRSKVLSRLFSNKCACTLRNVVPLVRTILETHGESSVASAKTVVCPPSKSGLRGLVGMMAEELQINSSDATTKLFMEFLSSGCGKSILEAVPGGKKDDEKKLIEILAYQISRRSRDENPVDTNFNDFLFLV